MGGLLERLRGESIEAVVAIGGGSAIDLAKVLALTARSDWRGESASLPSQAQRSFFIAVPTTAGTGSEVTPYASFESTEGRKFSFSDSRLLPDAVVLDPLLLEGQPKALAADAASDALSQAIESLWSRRATKDSRELASTALAVLVSEAPRAEQNADSRQLLQEAALVAGGAIALSQTTAVHSLSYPLTARFGVPHGRALAVLLPTLMRRTGPHLQDEVRSAICQACRVADWYSACAEIEKLLSELGQPRTLRELGLGEEALPQVAAEGGRPDRLGNHPCAFTQVELLELLKAALG